MRGRFAGAVLLGAASVAAANAADFTGGRGGYDGYSSFAVRMEPVIVYDFEPGVIVRSYWFPPLDNRHYFPRTGRRPRVGRLEHWPARRAVKPETYYRYWSVSSVFGAQQIPRSFAPGYGGSGYGAETR
jgi:hypothetical protein